MIRNISKEKKINVNTKSNELLAVLSNSFDKKINLARLKLICHFISALCKVQTVTFDKLARAFDSSAKETSSLRRIQRFIANYDLCPDLIARFIFGLLPKAEKYKLSIDRTNWKFGKTNINIFMLGIVYDGVAYPLLFKMLDKRGNSNCRERIDLINRFIRLFGKNNIESIVADREFVGEEWIKYLNENNIQYYIRIRNNFKVNVLQKHKEIKVSWLFQSYEFKHYPNIVKINKQLCYLAGCKLKSRDKDEYLIIISFSKPEKAKETYKERWQIEMCFKAMKSVVLILKKHILRILKE